MIWRPGVFTLEFSVRHLLNPPRTLANWTTVTMWGWDVIALAVAVGGLLSYMAVLTMRTRREQADRAPQQLFSSIKAPGGSEDPPLRVDGPEDDG